MDSTAYTPQQLGQALRGHRNAKNLTQKEAAALVGLLPKTVSNLELTPGRSTVDSLFKLLSALELEMVIRPKSGRSDSDPPEW